MNTSPMNKDVKQIIFDCLAVPEKFNFYLYCKQNNLTEELVYVEKYFQSLYEISNGTWYNIIIDNEHQLQNKFISMYRDVIDWYMLSIHQTFTPKFLIKFSRYIDWTSASRHQTFTIKSLQKHKFLIDWDLISTRADYLTEEILDVFSNEINWEYVKLLDFSDHFLAIHKDVINWANVSFSNIERYENYKEDIDWVRLSYHEDLTEDFMRRNQDRLDWNFLSSHQIMTDEFVGEFEDRVNIETRNFFNNRRSSASFEITGIMPSVPILRRQRPNRPAFFEY